MGCFLACLGSSKDKKGKRVRFNRVPSGARDQRRGYNPVEQVVYPEVRFKTVQRAALVNEDAKHVQQVGSPTEGEMDVPTVSVDMLQNKAVDEFSAGNNKIVQQETSPEKSSLATSPSSLCSRGGEKSADKSSSGAKKKVSFNSVVKTYEPVPSCELLVLDREEFSEDEKTVKPNRSNSDSEGSKTSSLVSYPPNHRYQNCRESDDEEDLDDEESDIDNDDSELEEDEYCDGDALSYSLCSIESTTRTRLSSGGRKSPEDNSHENIRERNDSNIITCGRDGYDQSVLNPVENLSQWKALKAMGKKPHMQRPQKENSAMEFNELPVSPVSHEPIFSQARRLQPKNGHPEHQFPQMAVDASLSNWLISQEPLNKSKTGATTVHNVVSQQTTSQGSYSHSPRSFDDRPILGAMTVEELKLLSSRTSSPRKSPSKSPDDMAIIGSVGSYWSREKSDKGSPQDSSGKGNPNTTSKYREDMRVNWDSTPFETRLEKALNQGSAEA